MKEFVKNKLKEYGEKHPDKLMKEFDEADACEYGNFGLHLDDDENCHLCVLKKYCAQYTAEQVGVPINVTEQVEQEKVKEAKPKTKVKKGKPVAKKGKSKSKVEKKEKSPKTNDYADLKSIHNSIKKKDRWNSGVVLLSKSDKIVLMKTADKKVIQELLDKALEMRVIANKKITEKNQAVWVAKK